MKTLLSLSLVFFFGAAFAQELSEKELKKHAEKIQRSKEKKSVVVSLDTIFNSGVRYAVLKKKNGDHSLFSITGKELLFITSEWVHGANGQEDVCYTLFTFMGSGQKAEYPCNALENQSKMIVDNDFVKDNDINAEAERKFLLKYPQKLSNASAPQIVALITSGTSGNSYQTVERNRNAGILVMGSEIKQDFKQIATYKKSSKAANGAIMETLSFYLPDGTLAAEATGEGVNAKQWRVVTMKDNGVHNVSTGFSKEAEDIAKYLSGRYYL